MDHVDKVLQQWHATRPDLDVAAMGTIGRLSRLGQHLYQGMAKTWAAHGMNAASFDVLATLRRADPPYALSPTALMQATMVTSGTMTHRIDQLERAGLVARIKNPDDGRGFQVTLTAQGFDAIDAAVTAHTATQNALLAHLPPADRAQLDDLLRRLLAGFEG